MSRVLRSFQLAILLLFTPIGPLVRGQQLASDKTDVAKIKGNIIRRSKGDGSSVTIRLRNGSELKGRITQTSENMFTLKEDKTRRQRDIEFADVVKVKGPGFRGLSRGAKFGILTAFITGAVVIGALVSMKNVDPFKNGVLR